jgi:OOP family OmpA-OmpF porin
MRRAFALCVLLAACDPAATPSQTPDPVPTQTSTPDPTATQTPTADPAPTQAPTTQTPTPTPPSGTFELDGDSLKLPGPIVFETASDVLKPESETSLLHVRDYLAAKPAITLLRIEGHTDNVGAASASQALSEARALAVAKWLVKKGVDCTRLIPVGFGSQKPIAPNDTADNRAQNRRITFVNAALRGHPIGGMPVEGSGKVAGDPCR